MTKIAKNRTSSRRKHGIGLVVAPYHSPVRDMISLVQQKVSKTQNAEIVALKEVAGAFEIPLQVKKILKVPGIDGVIVLGAIEHGETKHGEAIAYAVFPTLINLSLAFEIPVSLGIIGPKATPAQIKARASKVALEAVEALLGQLESKMG